MRSRIGTYGNAGRDSLQGPGAFNMDMSLMRHIVVHEAQHFEIRAEAFNVM